MWSKKLLPRSDRINGLEVSAGGWTVSFIKAPVGERDFTSSQGKNESAMAMVASLPAFRKLCWQHSIDSYRSDASRVVAMLAESWEGYLVNY